MGGETRGNFCPLFRFWAHGSRMGIAMEIRVLIKAMFGYKMMYNSMFVVLCDMQYS